MCLFDQEADSIELVLPGGQTAAFVPEIMLRANTTAQCGVRKDAGDDPDATHNALIKARVVLLDTACGYHQGRAGGWQGDAPRACGAAGAACNQPGAAADDNRCGQKHTAGGQGR